MLSSTQPRSKGVEQGQCTQLNNLARPYRPITLNLHHFVSFYHLFYVTDYRLMLSNDACKGGFSRFVQNVLVKIFSGGKPPDHFCFPYGAIKDIGNILANFEGVVIKYF